MSMKLYENDMEIIWELYEICNKWNYFFEM